MNMRRLANPAFIVAMVLLLGSAAGFTAAVSFLGLHLRKRPIEVALKVQSVPTETTSWKQIGKDVVVPPEVLETLGTSNYLTRMYVRTQPAPTDERSTMVAELHMAYYTGMVDTVPHVPDRCMVAGGMLLQGGPWDVPVRLEQKNWMDDAAATTDSRAALGDSNVVIKSARMGPTSREPGTRVRLPRNIENLALRVFKFKMPGSDEPYYSGYFFIANGGWTAKADDVRLLAFDLRSDYAYYLKVQVSSARVKSEQELAEVASSLLGELFPDIMRVTPDWTDVLRGDFPPDNPRRKPAPGT